MGSKGSEWGYLYVEDIAYGDVEKVDSIGACAWDSDLFKEVSYWVRTYGPVGLLV
jgi:hypothetical protein